MNQWNNLSSQQRILDWGKFRDEICPLTLDDQKNKIAEYFKQVPIAARQIDYYTPETWPSPWEILHYGQSCPSAISLLMVYTLMLNGQNDIKILLIDDKTDLYLVPLLADKYVLNFILGEVVEFDSIINDIEIKYSYNTSDIKDIY